MMKKHYYAIFKKTKDAIEVEFPDLPGCVTFGKNFDEAFEQANDVLAAWLANAEPKFIQEPSSYDALKKLKGSLIPIAVDENIMQSYQKSKRFNVIFPKRILSKIDAYRKKIGLKRSTFLQMAVEDYLQHHKT